MTYHKTRQVHRSKKIFKAVRIWRIHKNTVKESHLNRRGANRDHVKLVLHTIKKHGGGMLMIWACSAGKHSFFHQQMSLCMECEEMENTFH